MGDSGGPLVCEDNGQWTVHGATSHGYQCTTEKKPAVYSRVYFHLEWIKSHVGSFPSTGSGTGSPPMPGGISSGGISTGGSSPRRRSSGVSTGGSGSGISNPTGSGGGSCTDKSTTCAKFKHFCGSGSWWVKDNCKNTCETCR